MHHEVVVKYKKGTHIARHENILILLYQVRCLRFHVRTIKVVPVPDQPNHNCVLDVAPKAGQAVAQLEWVK